MHLLYSTARKAHAYTHKNCLIAIRTASETPPCSPEISCRTYLGCNSYQREVVRSLQRILSTVLEVTSLVTYEKFYNAGPYAVDEFEGVQQTEAESRCQRRTSTDTRIGVVLIGGRAGDPHHGMHRSLHWGSYEVTTLHQAAIHCDQSAVSRSLIETVPASLAVMERQTIFATLDHRSGYKRRAAGALGVSLKTLYNRTQRVFPFFC